MFGTVYFLICLINHHSPLIKSGEWGGRKIFCIVVLAWFYLECATQWFIEGHMALKSVLFIVTAAKLTTAPCTGIARAAHPLPACVSYPAALYVAFGWSRYAAVAFPLPRAPSPALLLARSRHARSRAPPSPSPLHPSPHPANGTTTSASPSSWRGTPQPSREPSVVSRPSCSRPPRPPRAKPGHRWLRLAETSLPPSFPARAAPLAPSSSQRSAVIVALCLALLRPVEVGWFLSSARFRWLLYHSWLYLLSWKRTMW
jgi:hypothetical protein